LSQISENNSFYYTFIPYVVLIVFGEKEKIFQKINLTIKESMNLDKFGKHWGMINTLFKCMFLDKINNKIFFNFDSLEDDKNELYNIILKENIQQNQINNNRIKISNLINDKIYNAINVKKVSNENLNVREKEINKTYARYKDNMFEISLLNYSLRKTIMTSDNSEDKYYIVPQNLLNSIFNLKNENKIFNMNLTNISLMSKYIGENINSILSSQESNNISEEQIMINKADIVDNKLKKHKKEDLLDKDNILNIISKPQKNFSRLKTFQKKENDSVETGINNINIENKFSNRYLFPKGILINKTFKKKVSITNLNELNQYRFFNIERDVIKKVTSNLNKNK